MRGHSFVFIFAIMLTLTASAALAQQQNNEGRNQDNQSRENQSQENEKQENEKPGELVFVDRFTDGLRNWWVEGSQKTWVEDEQLYIKASPETRGAAGYVASVWCKQRFEGDVRVEFEATSLSSKSAEKVNNINFFLHYTHPSEQTMYETRYLRADASYGLYHELPGYIFTFVRDRTESSPNRARFRVRWCPGFNLIGEHYDTSIGSEAETRYDVTIIKRGKELTFKINGKTMVQTTHDEREAHNAGMMGFRTFQSFLRIDNMKVYSLDSDSN